MLRPSCCWLVLLLMGSPACVERYEDGATCGPGQLEIDDVCVVPDGGPGATCGPGTHLSNGVCVADADDDVTGCGPGTHLENGVCVADPQIDAGLPACGPGTHLQDGVCVADLVCGPNTVPIDGQCVSLGQTGYELRVPITDVPADGHSRFPVLALGTRDDGSPATDAVVLDVDRPAVGTFQPAAFTLGQLGTEVAFTPCNAFASPSCAGPVTITMALASAPETPVASVTVNLVEPVGVGSIAMCLAAPNVMYFDGNDYIYNGTLTVTEGVWSAQGDASSLFIGLTPSGQQQGLWWDLDFSSAQLGLPLEPGVYEMAERRPFASPGHPGLEVTGDGRGCNTIAGRFQVHEYTRSGNQVTGAMVSFEQHCEGGAPVLNGCVHYEAP